MRNLFFTSFSKNAIKLGVFASTFAIVAGCSQIYRTGANIALGFAEKHIVPPILTLQDTNMACESSNATAPLIIATKALGADPAKIATLMYSGAALCAEEMAVEEELRYMRAAKAGQVEEAQDARIAQKRWAGIAGKRQYEGYLLFAEHYETKYNIRIGEDCPNLKTDFDQTIYMLGMLTGLQAVQSDVASDNAVGVPKDIAAKVERGMKCLDNEKFWGVPLATRAAIWTLLPGASEGKPDPFLVMQEQAKLGQQKGVRLASAIYALAAATTGDDTLTREAIRAYGNTIDNTSVHPDYKLFDKMGGIMVRNISDRYWTQNTGTRTPDGGMVKFWDEQTEIPTVDIDLSDIL